MGRSTNRTPRQPRPTGCLAALVAGLALLLPGCAETSVDRSLAFRLPARFSQAATRSAEPGLDRWWLQFRSARLAQLVDQADADNLDIAAAIARLDQADAQVRIAGAPLFPVIGLTADARQSRASGTTGRRGAASLSPIGSFETGLSASYVLDIWGRVRDGLRAAELDAEAADYAREVIRLATQGSVVNAYLQYALALEQQRIANSNVRNAERILGVVRERLAAGTGTALDLAQQESLLANERANIPPLRQAAATARHALALLLGRPPQGLALADVSLNALAKPAVAPGLPATLLLRRPDIRNAEALLAASEANLDVARKALLPAIQLTASGGFQSAALSSVLRPESALFSLAAGLTQPIFEGGRLRAEIALSDAQRRERLELYRKTIVSALTDVENALTAIREGDQREAALKDAIAKAQRALELAEERLRQGTIDLVILLNTQQTLFAAQDAIARTRFARLQASVALFQALGGDVTIRDRMLASRASDTDGSAMNRKAGAAAAAHEGTPE